MQALPTGTHVAVVGRCDDIGAEAYNEDLAHRRAARAKQLLMQWGLEEGRIHERGEQDPWAGPDDGRPTEATIDDWKADSELPAGWRSDPHGQHESERAPFRRADLYAYTPAAAPAPTPTGTPTLDPSRLRRWYPAPTPPPTSGPARCRRCASTRSTASSSKSSGTTPRPPGSATRRRSEPRHWCSGRVRRSSSRRRAPGRPR